MEILNGLKWTEELDKVFKENEEKDPGILWQYFGSQTGFMRTWPGISTLLLLIKELVGTRGKILRKMKITILGYCGSTSAVRPNS